MQYAIYFIISVVLSIGITGIVRLLMMRYNVIDDPKAATRKIHKKPMPLGGGVGIFITFFSIVGIAFLLGHIGEDIKGAPIIGLAIGGLILMIGGLWDDIKTLRPWQQIIFPLAAAIIAIVSGIGIESLTNPTGGVLYLDIYHISIYGLGQWMLFADIVVFFWLMAMMFTTKLLDGLDGLATGIVAIGAGIMFLVTQQQEWWQPEVGLISLIFFGVCLGFLYWNFHPAKIFLGEGGSLLIGFILGGLAIISGSKIATTLLVMGIPMLDMMRVIVRRLKGKRSIFVGDSEHIHFQLLASGASQRQAVLLLYGISCLFGMSTFFLQKSEQLAALSFLFVLMLLIAAWFNGQKK
ncbi:MAG: undecaprenyl/decaprenyl-phosphate alpha-N-acetylglucosaminyl 1-phosphate transferase [Candidatus Magasanikbacteria bacterium]|nr:undecaprenyl/decaprenyl-phosphate alpha-N-acetylglucosaminyl 1-phosphate transferase [Candidatus Magasanikbacteria bacterium]MBT4071877.1 undecaprenyl/decaprenyl-phosphate alpha-N-acetylglucosaminyl 1-phosphate transferase [Candidatus Magasanikbacteria bacterium]